MGWPVGLSLLEIDHTYHGDFAHMCVHALIPQETAAQYSRTQRRKHGELVTHDSWWTAHVERLTPQRAVHAASLTRQSSSWRVRRDG